MESTFPDPYYPAGEDWDASAPWLQLDAAEDDVETCGGSLESRSCFDFDGRAVRVRLFLRQGEAPRSFVETASGILPAERSILVEYSEIAERLLAHAYDGLTQDCPVVVAAHTVEFAEGGSLAALVEFTRNSLPAVLRHACKARVFARDPEPFIQAGANLMAIPRDSATRLMTLRRDAILLDSDAHRIDLREPPGPALAYARIAVAAFRQSAELIEALLRRVDAMMQQPALPGDAQLEWMQSAAEWLAGTGNVPFDPSWSALDADWALVLSPEEWERIPCSILTDLALRREAPALQSLAVAEVGRRAESPRSVTVPLTPLAWDAHVREDAPSAINLMLEARYWAIWRESTGCLPFELREASLAWMGSPYWLSHEPFLEDWTVVIRDLDGDLTDSDVERIAGMSSRSGVFPQIRWFEDRQFEDLRRLRKLPHQTLVTEVTDGEADTPDPPEPQLRGTLAPAPVEILSAEFTEKASPVTPRRVLRWWWILLTALLAFSAGIGITLLWKTK